MAIVLLLYNYYYLFINEENSLNKTDVPWEAIFLREENMEESVYKRIYGVKSELNTAYCPNP